MDHSTKYQNLMLEMQKQVKKDTDYSVEDREEYANGFQKLAQVDDKLTALKKPNFVTYKLASWYNTTCKPSLTLYQLNKKTQL